MPAKVKEGRGNESKQCRFQNIQILFLCVCVSSRMQKRSIQTDEVINYLCLKLQRLFVLEGEKLEGRTAAVSI